MKSKKKKERKIKLNYTKSKKHKFDPEAFKIATEIAKGVWKTK